MNHCADKMGYCEVIYGPMKSGKTSRLLQLYKQFKFCEVPVMVINHCMDTRYSETQLSSHDQIMIPCISSMRLKDIIDISKKNIFESGTHIDEFAASDVILINEAQFFEDIVSWVTIAVEKYKKSVYVCGLNSDFRRKPFGNWLDLELICDKVTQLHSWCGLCKKQQALFSHRLTHETEKIVIGSDNYISVCRKCWLTLNN
jgi:thymidine kinase